MYKGQPQPGPKKHPEQKHLNAQLCSQAVGLQIHSPWRRFQPRNLTLRDSPHQRVMVFQSAILASGVLSKEVVESQFSKRTSVRNRGIGDLNTQGGHLFRIHSLFSKSSVPYTKAHNSGQLHKKPSFISLSYGVDHSSFECLWENISSRSTAIKTFLPKRIIMQAN